MRTVKARSEISVPASYEPDGGTYIELKKCTVYGRYNPESKSVSVDAVLIDGTETPVHATNLNNWDREMLENDLLNAAMFNRDSDYVP